MRIDDVFLLRVRKTVTKERPVVGRNTRYEKPLSTTNIVVCQTQEGNSKRDEDNEEFNFVFILFFPYFLFVNTIRPFVKRLECARIFMKLK